MSRTNAWSSAKSIVVPVIICLVAVVTGCRGSDETTSEIASTSTSRGNSSTSVVSTPAPQPTFGSTTSARDTEPAPFPSQACCSGLAIAPGVYGTPSWFDPPFEIQVDDGWRVLNEGAASLLAIVRGAGNPSHLPSELIVFLDASSAATLDALMGQFRAEPAITPVSEQTETTLAGFDGLQQDFSVLPNEDNKGNPDRDIPPGVRSIPVMSQFFSPGFSWTSSTPEAHMRVVAVDIGDMLLLVTLEAPAESFQSFVADADRVLETLTPLES